MRSAEEARLFESLHPGTKVELSRLVSTTLQCGDHSTGGLRDGRFDLALLVTDWLAEGMQAGALEDLNLWQQARPFADWPEGWPRSLVKPLIIDDRLSSSAVARRPGMPCLPHRSLCRSRNRNRVSGASFGRELAPPPPGRNSNRRPASSPTLAPVAMEPCSRRFPDGHNTLYDFALQLWSRGGELTDPGWPSRRSPLRMPLEALDFYRRMVRDPAICHPVSPQLDSTQSGDLFLRAKWP